MALETVVGSSQVAKALWNAFRSERPLGPNSTSLTRASASGPLVELRINC